MSKRISLIVGGVLAILAVVLIKIYLDQQTQALAIRARQASEKLQEQKERILVAEQKISAGIPITSEMLGVVMIYKEQLDPRIATSFGEVVGKTAGKDIERGEPILKGMLIASKRPRKTRASSLSVATPAGKRAIAVQVKEIQSVGGMLKPGDHVDILCTIPYVEETKDKKKSKKKQELVYPVFQNVLVLAVGTDIGYEDPQKYAEDGKKRKKVTKPAKIITVALTPQESSMLAFVTEQGEIQMVLRSPEDKEIVEDIEPANLEALLDQIMPRKAPKRKPKQIIDTPRETIYSGKDVEIIRGLELEVVPLSQ